MTSLSLRKLQTTPWKVAARTRVLALLLAATACSTAVHADEPKALATEPKASAAEQSQQEPELRMNELRDWLSFGDSREFWERENARVQRTGSLFLNKPLDEIMEPHLLEIPPPQAIDTFDQKPIIARVSATVDRAVETSDEASSATSSRLKTDIRSIQPSLSYALKDIPPEQLPEDFATGLNAGEYVARKVTPTVLQWAPTNFYHYPLYFEDPALERYGHTYSPMVQPFVSTARFAGQLFGLPYQMAIHPVNSRQYSLGYYRPGEYAPKKLYQIPFNEEATVMEAAVLTGLILILP